MRVKNAIGISINGNNVKAAFLSLIKGKVHIMGLQSTTLSAPLENSRSFEKSDENIDGNLEQAFDINQPANENNPGDEAISVAQSKNTNISIIYSVIDKFKDVHTNVGFNAPVLTVKYEIIDADSIPGDNGIKQKLKQKVNLLWNESDSVFRSSYQRISHDKFLRVDFEHHPPVIDLIDEVSQFRRGRLKLQLMDTNELALAYLVRKSYRLRKHYTTAIIYIEPDFSRVIFLKGNHIHQITPIIHKGSISKDVLDVVYSKIIFAQDHHSIPELDKIVLACRCAKLKAKEYFKEKFPSSKIGYLNSKLIKSEYKMDKGGRLFSQYAIPIAFAWKLLQKKSSFTRYTNLLPDYILERQKMPKLAFHGYALLFLLAITAFTFTWLLITKNVQISKINHKNRLIKSQIEINKPLAEKVKFYDEEIAKFEKNIALGDSLTTDYSETFEFLNMLNQSVLRAGGIWVSELKVQGKQVSIKGLAVQREKIPIFSNALGGASLKKVTRTDYLDNRAFSYHLDKNIEVYENTQDSNVLAGLKGAKNTNSETSNGSSKTNGSTKDHK